MRLYQKLVLFMLAATVLPVAVVGFQLLSTLERELSVRIADEQRAVAVAASETIAAQLMAVVNGVARSAELIDWARASPEELKGGLSLLYQQSPAVSAAAVVGPDGALRGEPVYLPNGGAGHLGFSPQGLPELLKAVPLSTLREGGKGQAALSAAYPHSLGQLAALALAVKLAAGPEAPFALVELTTQSLEEVLAERATRGSGALRLVDSEGRVLASSERGWVLRPVDKALWSRAQALLTGERAVGFALPGESAQRVSAARVGELGMTALVTVDEAVALAPVRQLRRTVLASIGAALAVLLLAGVAFTRMLNGRLAQVVQGAEAFARGELSARIPLRGADELTELGAVFNRMGAELETSRAKLLSWNDELKARVEEATADLRSAQAQLLEAQKLAAVGQLGAGVAHEINNPLAGILGNAQLLMLDRDTGHPDFDALRKIEQSAKRCKEITQNLLRFSQQRDRAELRPVDLNALVRDALALNDSQLSSEAVALDLRLSPGQLMVSGDPGHLTQVILAVISNARTAMLKSATKRLTVATAQPGEEVQLDIRDSGKGISPEHLGRVFEPFFTTKDIWSNVGLGLSVAYRVATEHAGKIEIVETAVGQGTLVRLRLPTLASGKAAASALRSATALASPALAAEQAAKRVAP